MRAHACVQAGCSDVCCTCARGSSGKGVMHAWVTRGSCLFLVRAAHYAKAAELFHMDGEFRRAGENLMEAAPYVCAEWVEPPV